MLRALIRPAALCVAALAPFARAQSLDAKLVPADLAAQDAFGSAVAIRGQTLVVGAPLADPAGTSSGSAYVYVEGVAGWSLAAKLAPGDHGPGDRFGADVAVTDTRIVVGAPGQTDANGVACGAIYVFELVAGTWTQTVKLTPSDGTDADGFGTAVAADLEQVVVGAPFADGAPLVVEPGAVYVFANVFGAWVETDKVIEEIHGQNGDAFGSCVDLSGDRFIAGAPLAFEGGNQRGRAQVCVPSPVFGWMIAQTLTSNAFNPDLWEYGTAVALDGDRALVTSPFGGPVGGQYIPGIVDVWEANFAGVWTRVERVGPASVDLDDLENGIGFGVSVDLDGDTFVVGSRDGHQNGDGRGAAWVFRKTPAGFAEIAKLVPSDSAVQDAFASSVAVSGERVTAGVRADDDVAANCGAAWTANFPLAFLPDFVGVPAYLHPCGTPCGHPGAQTMLLDAGPSFAQAQYFVLGSITGTAPGVAIGSFHLPLNVDAYTLFTAQGISPVVGQIGQLDATGRATLAFVLPPNLFGLPLEGLGVHHAAIVFDGQGQVAAITQATHFTFSQ